MPAPAFDETYADTREVLRRVATHIVSRAQDAHSGRIGLRAAPGGFGTTEYGPDSERVRVSGGVLVHESRPASGAATRAIEIDGATLDDLARFVGVDLSEKFSVGSDTPPPGDVDAPIRLPSRPRTAVAVTGTDAAGPHPSTGPAPAPTRSPRSRARDRSPTIIRSAPACLVAAVFDALGRHVADDAV